MITYQQAGQIDVILHIGLQKTGSTFMQNQMSESRYDLMEQGILYPIAGQVDFVGQKTRDGAQSGHAVFSQSIERAAIAIQDLFVECSPSTRSIIISSENFTLHHRETTPAEYLDLFRFFRSVQVVAVVRRQDRWLESLYKQTTDAFADRETRTFTEFFNELGRKLIDFEGRLAPWRAAAGTDHFHVISYDDVDDLTEVPKKLISLAGGSNALAERVTDREVARYDSVQNWDTLALRILNLARFDDIANRTSVVRALNIGSKPWRVRLMDAELRSTIQKLCKPGNQAIAADWANRPMPGFTFEVETSDDNGEVSPELQGVFDELGQAISLANRERERELSAVESSTYGLGSR